MSATEPSTHIVRVEFRVEADKGTRRRTVLDAVRQRAVKIRLSDSAGCRITDGSVKVCFEGTEDNLAAERGW